MDRDIKKDLVIDDNNLEGEWSEQGSRFYYYAEAHAEALHIKDIKKAKLDYEYATLYSDLKKNWNKVWDAKPTEPALKEHIYSTKSYKKAERAHINATKDANIMLAAKQAFEHRKLALSNKVSLMIGGFYSEPRNKVKDIQTSQMRNSQKEGLKNATKNKSKK